MLKPGSLISSKVKSIVPLPFPLFMGFAVGVLSAYSYYLIMNYDAKKFISVTIRHNYINEIHFNIDQNTYHGINMTKPAINNTSLLCLIFINDIDYLYVQQNVWLDKCGNNKMYVSKQKHMYIGHVLTETYSPKPWKYYCQTLLYLHKKYNSDTIKYDWIFLAKDNIWLIYENLMHLISLLNASKHKYFYASQYINGVINVNAGLLLSANTLAALFHLLSSMDACNENTSVSESLILGECSTFKLYVFIILHLYKK